VVALVWVGRAQRVATSETVLQQRAGDDLFDTAFDMETGIGGFVLTGQPSFLQLAQDARTRFALRLDEARRVSADTPGTASPLTAQADSIERWWALTDRQLMAVATGTAGDLGEYARARNVSMDEFRAANRAYQVALGRAHVGALDDATRLAIIGILGTGLSFLLLGYVLVLRADRRTARRAVLDARFTERMLFTRSEPEAQRLLGGHLEALLPGAWVEVMGDPADDRLAGCDAYRSGVPVERSRGAGASACATCVASGPQSLCTPLRFGDATLGAVLVGASRASLIDARAVRQAAGQAAPVLANLRNLATAEEHATTDALTGLPNRRAVDDSLRRMAAQAERTARPLAAVLLDIDHFKDINDRWGHEQGDAVLAALARVLRSTVRASDFVGRSGGEEFVLLLPATDRKGARAVAQNVRRAIARATFPTLDRGVTASLGIAVFPDDCDDSTRLLARADGAMYAAKSQGRNRVVAAAPEADPVSPDGPSVASTPAGDPAPR
jgi:diguanylate cyclase (GGDEF)-like protein